MDDSKKSLEDLLRDELGGEPSQEAKDYARQLYERFRLPAADPGANGVAAPAAPAASADTAFGVPEPPGGPTGAGVTDTGDRATP